MISSKLSRITRALVVASVAGALAVTGLPSAPAVADPSAAPIWQDDSGKYTFEERAADLVSRLTVAEKYNQLRDNPPAITRLGIRSYGYWNEALHGVVGYSGATMFPSATAISSTWNRGLVRQLGTIIGDEARMANNTTNKGLSYWSPTLNIYRDPRWGRADESYGEDPYQIGQIGAEFVQGVQGDDPTYLKAVSTPKHFFANNSESNRRHGNSVVTEREIREYYTPAFAYALSPEVGAYSYMTAYNRVNGVPMTDSYEYLDTLVKRTWGFEGYVTTDCSTIKDSTVRHLWVPDGWDHPVDLVEATAWGIKAGADIDCQDYYYRDYMQQAYDLGYVTNAELDSELQLLLTARFKFGEFDTASKVPYRNTTVYNTANRGSLNPDSQAVSLAVAHESPILLKNNAITSTATKGLPLTAADDDIVVIGPYANTFTAGGYSGSGQTDSRSFVTALTQVAAEVNPDATVTYLGAGVTPGSGSGKPGVQGVTFKNAGADVQTIRTSQTVNGYPLSTSDNPAPGQFIKWEGWMGISWGAADYMSASQVWGGYLTARVDFTTMSADSMCMIQNGSATAAPAGAVFDVHLDAMDGPIVATVPASGVAGACGQPGADGALDPSVLGGIHDLYIVWNPGTLGAVGQAGTVGHPWAYNFTPAQEQVIRDADAVLVFLGTTTAHSTEEMDRTNIDFPLFQDQLTAKVAALNPHTVVWMQTVGQMNIEAFRSLTNIPSIVWTNYNGQHQGVAAADIIFGRANPSGKLPMTWYSNLAQLGSVWDYQITPDADHYGRTYQYFTGTVSYPYGYGLSYSSYQYSNLRLDASAYAGDDTLTAYVDVTNSSSIPGKETVQLYVTAPGADGVNRPIKQLKGFEKVSLGAFQTKTVAIEVDLKDLWFWDDVKHSKTWDLGTWKVFVGPSSTIGQVKQFELVSAPLPYLDVVQSVPDGLVLNTASPDTVIHSNLSATRNDQTFLDLAAPDVEVVYTSKNPQVAKVDADGLVYPVSPGVTTISVAVTWLGTTKTDSYPVVVEGDDADPVINVADQVVELSKAGSIPVNAEVKLAADGAVISYDYLIAGMDENTAGATIDPLTGVVSATQVGKVRFTVVADIDGVKLPQSAEITIVPDGALTPNPAALNAAIADAEALAKTATAASVASSGLNAAIATAKNAVLTATTQKDLDRALEALQAAVTAATSGLVLTDSPSARAAMADVVQAAISTAEAIKSDGYTAASYALLVTAIAQAKGLPAGATVAQSQAALDAINAAIKGLTHTPAPTTPDTKTGKVTTTSVTVSGAAFKKNTKPKVTVVVKLSKGYAKGKVAIYVGGKKVKSFNAIKTKTTVTLPKKYAKAIKVKVKYTPVSATYGTTKASATKTVKIKK
ncbi:MAG: glycoside hydrolase family 3 C-terminal domain-containing protein [Propionibacteriaceae bacterium]|jgi:beta-glucosidase-like glycosyl hydrolase|nr:glycoside hydrolase family 3 C-terminal domain-containing protein [Propionibacteriaceae bacterium]